MPRPLVDYAEPGGSKLKRSKGFLEPNFGVVPNEALTNTLTAGFYCRSNISPCTGLKLDFCYLQKLICRYRIGRLTERRHWVSVVGKS